MNRLSRLVVVLALIPIAAAVAETDQERKAREDLERQLKSMVGTPPTKIKIEYVGLDQPNYELTEASFKLDGRNLPADLAKLNLEGDHVVFHGDVLPGPHHLESKFVFVNRASQMISAEGGFKSKPGSDVSFTAAAGIEVQVKVTPELNLGGDAKNRITVKSPATVAMLAKLDDGTMPEPAVRPGLVVTVDAGIPTVAVAAPQTPADKAAAKKQKAEEAKAAKLAAVEAKKQKAEEAKAAKLAAAEAKKQKAEEAKAAKAAAVEEKKRAAEEAKAAKVAAAEAKRRPVGLPVAPLDPPAGSDAGAVVAGPPEVVDAGAAEVVAAVPPVEPAPEEEASALPLPVLIGLGVALLGLVLFFLARRSANPKY